MSYITIVEDIERIPKHFGESTIWHRRYSTAVHKEIEKPFKHRRKNRQGEVYYEIDEDGLNDAMIDYLIIELEKVKDGKGGFVETTLKNKLSLPGDVVVGVMEDSGAASIIRGKDDTTADPTRKTSEDT